MDLPRNIPVTYIRDPDVTVAVSGTIVTQPFPGGIQDVNIVGSDITLIVSGTVTALPPGASATTLVNAVSSTGVHTSSDLSAYTQHTLQHVITGVVSAITRTSLDGSNWVVEATSQQSGIFTINSRVKYIQVEYANGSGTLTTLVLSS